MSILSSTQSFVEVLVKAKVYKVFTKQFLIIFYKRKYEENAKDVLFAKKPSMNVKGREIFRTFFCCYV